MANVQQILRLRSLALAALLILTMGLIAACSGDDGDDQQAQQRAEQQQEQAAPQQQQEQQQPAPERPTASSGEALKIGFLADYTGDLAEFGPAIETGVQLAIKHLNDAGGVFGQPVELVTGDTGLDQTRAVEEARRLIEVEGVHAIVGPLASSITLAVAESVTGPSGIPTISPSATSPQISIADDNGYLFRSTVSDAAQGPALARLAAEEGFANVGVLFIDDPYGQGLAESFADAWGGERTMVGIQGGNASYLSELQSASRNGADVLIAIAFPTQAEVFLREAIENDLFSRFLFVDGTKSQDLIDAIGGEHLDGMKGTAPVSGPASDSQLAFQDAYVAEYGELSPLPFIAEAYDAALAIGLAAAAAGSTDGAAIRDALPRIGAPGGVEATAGPEGVASALAAIARSGDIDYEGVATTLNWNSDGDVTSGYIGIWQYHDGHIDELSVEAFDLSDGIAVVAPSPRPAPEPLVIGWLADFSGALAEYGQEMETGVELAVAHVNASGGVLGRTVAFVSGDTVVDPTIAVSEARRLVEIEGAIGLVGPVASVTTLPVGESVSGPLGIPTVTPAATSPQISLADDNGYLFRATISDAAQGPVLAQLAEDAGYSRVGVIYRDDPYGQGLAEAFAAAYSGEAELVAISPMTQPTYLAELQRAAAGDSEALIVVAFPQEAEVFLREAIEQGLFDQFLFVDGSKSPELIAAIGGEYLNGMKGTAQAPGPETPSLAAWNESYVNVYGELPTLPFVAETYDAAMALMLAIEAAGSTDGEAIRAALAEISSPGGDIVIPGVEGIALGLETIRNGGDINYEGAATTLDWNEIGDVTSGYIGIWQYADGGIEEVEQIPFSLE